MADEIGYLPEPYQCNECGTIEDRGIILCRRCAKEHQELTAARDEAIAHARDAIGDNTTLHEALAAKDKELEALRAERDKLLVVVKRAADDGLAGRIARDCHDPRHDDRWCSTCEGRADGIEAFQLALFTSEGAGALEADGAREAAQAAAGGKDAEPTPHERNDPHSPRADIYRTVGPAKEQP